MTDPRSTGPEASPFVAPSNPGFAPPPQGTSATVPGPTPAPWPGVGTVPFTPHRRSASRTAVVGLVLSAVGALIGLAVGWGFPLSIIGLVLAVRARREPGPSRSLGRWSIVLAVVSGLASVAWLSYSLVVLLT